MRWVERVCRLSSAAGLASARVAAPTAADVSSAPVRGVFAGIARAFGAAPTSPLEHPATRAWAAPSTDRLVPAFRGGVGFAALPCAGSTPAWRGSARGKTTGVGVFVGGDQDVERAVRKIRRKMMVEGIERAMQRQKHFVKGAERRVIAKRERDHRKWRKALRSKLGWIVRRKDRGF
jgi:ribosomal protein S21